MIDDENPTMRHVFHEAPPSSIDLAAVTRRSRARRLPKVIGIGAAGIIAIAGFGAFGVQAVAGFDGGVATAALDSAAGDAPVSGPAGADTQSNEALSSYDSGKRRAATDLNECAAAPIDAQPSALGLVMTIAIPDSAAASENVAGTVTLTNSSAAAVTVYTAQSPTITVSRSGAVVWQGTAALGSPVVEFTLEPGESRSYPVDFAPRQCTPSAGATDGASTVLPALPSGTYAVSAALDVWGVGDADLVMTPTTQLLLR
jgi:hypothetical protein